MELTDYDELLLADAENVIELRYDDFNKYIEAADATLGYGIDMDGRYVVELTLNGSEKPEVTYPLKSGETVFFTTRPRYKQRQRIRPWQSLTAPREEVETIVAKEPSWLHRLWQDKETH